MPHVRNPQPVRERMPETIVKIIGSKYVRFPVEKSKEGPIIDKDTKRNIQRILGGIQDTESFRQSLLSRDRSSRGLLPVSEFQAVCASHGAPLALSSLTPLLEDNVSRHQGSIRGDDFMSPQYPDLLLPPLSQEQGSVKLRHEEPFVGSPNCRAAASAPLAFILNDKISRWKQIVDLLQEAEKEKKVTEKQEEAPRRTGEEGSGQSHHGDLTEKQTSESSFPANRSDHRPMSEPALHLLEHSSSDEQEAWIDRFMKLENVLRLCQIKDTGLVDAVRAAQIIKKYNVIHGLCLSAEKIAAALDTFRMGVYILLEPALHFLKDL